MRLVCLNAWGGTEFKNLIKFIEDQKNRTDIFCFQEIFSTGTSIKESHGMRPNLYQELLPVLKEFQPFFEPVVEGKDLQGDVDFPVEFGLAIFAKGNILVKNQGSIEIFPGTRTADDVWRHKRVLQYIVVENTDQNIIGNVHGLHLGGNGKKDTPERIRQSQIIQEFFASQTGKKILCGDFNLLPDTESVRLLENDMRNLISHYKIPTTRSKLYTRGVPFADYTFVSPDVKVKSFEVPNVEASDHLPMILEFT